MSASDSITPIVEYRLVNEDLGYRVGNEGSVWCCLIRAAKGSGSGSGSTTKPGPTWRRLKPHVRRGHLYVSIRGKTRGVHQLVLEAFVGPCPPGMEACHDDDIATNNHVSNLRWDTHKANCDDRAKNGRVPVGEKHHWSKLTDTDVREIRATYAGGGIGYKALGDKYGVDTHTIRRIILGRTWKQVI